MQPPLLTAGVRTEPGISTHRETHLSQESSLCPHQRGLRQELSGGFCDRWDAVAVGLCEEWSTLGGMPQNAVPKTARTNYHSVVLHRADMYSSTVLEGEAGSQEVKEFIFLPGI